MRNVNDLDIENCKAKSVDRKQMGPIILLLIALPALTFYFFGDLAADAMANFIFPLIFTGFVAANAFLYSISIYYIIIPYGMLALGLLWLAFLYKPLKKHRANMRKQWKRSSGEEQESKKQ